MKWWIDAQLPSSLCAWLLTHHGIESEHVKSCGLLDAIDGTIFASLRRPGQVIVTKDSDFVDLAIRLGTPPQIVHIRSGNCSNKQLFASLDEVLPQLIEQLRANQPIIEVHRRPAPEA